MTVHFTGKTALVVDDEFLIASMIEDILARRGIEVVTATHAEEAVAHLDGRKVDFAVIDYQLRNSPAEEVWNTLTERKIPFAFCTGSLAEEMRERFPGITIIPKPFSEEAIIDAAAAMTA